MTKRIDKIWFDMADYNHYCHDISDGLGVPASSDIVDNNPILDIIPIRCKHDFCYVSVERTRIVITFAGSDDFQDWISNVQFKKNAYDIHHEFYDSAKLFWRELGQIIEAQHVIYGKDVYFTGWSRGGALALITAWHFANNCNTVSEVYTIVDPRVGGKGFRSDCKRLPIHIHHLHQRCGIVDDVPARVMGYRDVGHITYLRPKWWYFLPSLAIRWTKIHLDWYNNLQRQKPK